MRHVRLVHGESEVDASLSTANTATRAYLDHFWKVDAWLHALRQVRCDPPSGARLDAAE